MTAASAASEGSEGCRFALTPGYLLVPLNAAVTPNMTNAIRGIAAILIYPLFSAFSASP
jgi:hypothetical protein